MKLSLAWNTSFSLVSHISVRLYTATNDIKPDVWLSLTWVTSTTNGFIWLGLPIAILARYVSLLMSEKLVYPLADFITCLKGLYPPSVSWAHLTSEVVSNYLIGIKCSRCPNAELYRFIQGLVLWVGTQLQLLPNQTNNLWDVRVAKVLSCTCQCFNWVRDKTRDISLVSTLYPELSRVKDLDSTKSNHI